MTRIRKQRLAGPQTRTSAQANTPDDASEAGSLYVVATPIGNLSDLGLRARDILQQVALVAAEDTRVSRRLLDHVGARATMLSAHEHNELQAAQTIVDRLTAGEDVALVSDAGTPAVSDPGRKVVAAVQAAGLRVIPIPGPSAITTLLSAAGLACEAFLFGGFLPTKKEAREARLRVLRSAADNVGACLLLYEAPHRIEATLAALPVVFEADQPLVIGRELTKLHEEIGSMHVSDGPSWFAARPERRLGEFVLAIGQRVSLDEASTAPAATDTAAPDPGELLAWLLAEMPLSRAVKLAQKITGLPHRTLYAQALALNAAP